MRRRSKAHAQLSIIRKHSINLQPTVCAKIEKQKGLTNDEMTLLVQFLKLLFPI